MTGTLDANLHKFLLTTSDIEAFESVPLKQHYPWDSTYDLITQAGQKYGDSLALAFLVTAEMHESPIEVTFTQVIERINQTANLLYELGVNYTDAVSIVLPNLLETHFALWGSQAAGISNPINPLLEAEHIAEIMNATQAKVLITVGPDGNSELLDKINLIVDLVPSLTTVLLVSSGDSLPTIRKTSIKLLNFSQSIEKQEKNRLISNRKFSGDDIAAYFHTGGTTGRPKVARLTHGNIAFVSQLYAKRTEYIGRFNMLSGLPLFHIFGAVIGGVASLYSGRAQILMTAKGFRTPKVIENWWHHVARFKTKAFAVVPTLLSVMMQTPVGDEDISNLKYIASGASAIPEPLKKAFEKKYDVFVSSGYGMTESSCLLTGYYPEYPAPTGSVGTRLPYMEMQIAQVVDNRVVKVCEACEVGEVLVRGPHIFAGYLNPSDNEKAWVDHTWFNTGDRGMLDSKGNLTLTGRAKDLIIRGGHNIDPLLIEEPLQKHPAIAMAVAIGQPDPHAGEIPVAYVTLAPGQSADSEQLLTYCQQNISERAAVPKRIEIINAMPLTAVAKIFKPELRNQATQYVINKVLDDANIESEVSAEMDTKRGQVVKISLAQSSQQQAAQKALMSFPLTIEFVS